MILLYFNYICHNCGKQNNWFIPQVNIKDFYCENCQKHIGCSNGHEIKLIEPKKFDQSRYSITEQPEDYYKPRPIAYSTTGVTNTTGTYTYNWSSV